MNESPDRHVRPPQRVRVTSPRMGASRRPEHRSATREIDEQTGIGEVYLGALLRSQLTSGLALLGLVVLALGGLPVLFILLPGVANQRVGPVTVAWLILGVLVFPGLFAAAWWQVRTAERIERDFTRILHSPLRTGPESSEPSHD